MWSKDERGCVCFRDLQKTQQGLWIPKHKAKALTEKEVINGRSNAYNFLYLHN